MKYRLTKLGRLVVLSATLLTVIILVIIASQYLHNLDKNSSTHNNNLTEAENNQILEGNTDNNPYEIYENKDSDIENDAPEIIEVVDNTDILKNMNLSVYFGPNISVLEEENYEELNLFGETAQILQGSLIQIEGNCATTSTNLEDKENNDFNYNLSFYRAESVADYFIDMGINSDRLIIIGNGAEKPAKSNNTPNGRKYNRRVDVFFKILEK